jgi:hypothetical protein
MVKHIFEEQSFYCNKVLLDKVGRMGRAVEKIESKRR